MNASRWSPLAHHPPDMKKTALCSAFFGLLLGGIGQSATLAYWNFNTLAITGTLPVSDASVPDSIPADTGTAALALSPGWAGGVASFGGTTINAIGADVSGASLSLGATPTGSGTAPFAGNASYVEIVSLDLTGQSDIGITYATRGTATGFNSGVWSYSISGGAFTPVAGSFATRTTSFALTSVDLRPVTALNGASSVTLRYTLDGATTNAGNNRIDNLQVVSNFVPVPETSTPALGLFTAAMLLRRRRR